MAYGKLSTRAALLLAATLATPAWATQYWVTDLQPLAGYVRGALGDTSYGLNASGQSVGRSTSGPNGDRATLWDAAGHPTELATPGDTWFSKADGINSAGVIVGDVGVGAQARDTIRAARWTSPGHYEFFLADNGYASFADQINDNGWITGIRYNQSTDDFPEHWDAFVWSPDGTTRWVAPFNTGYNLEFLGINNANTAAGVEFFPDDPSVSGAAIWTAADGTSYLPDRGLYYTTAVDLNDAGFIAGVDYDGDITDSALWWDPAHNVHVLPALPGMAHSIPTRINALNQIVGWSLPDACDFEDRLCRTATLWTLDGTATDLNTLINPALGDRLMWANGINDAGQIYGEAVHSDGSRFVFLLTPGVPEPAIWAQLIAGFMLVGVILRGRRRMDIQPIPSARAMNRPLGI